MTAFDALTWNAILDDLHSNNITEQYLSTRANEFTNKNLFNYTDNINELMITYGILYANLPLCSFIMSHIQYTTLDYELRKAYVKSIINNTGNLTRNLGKNMVFLENFFNVMVQTSFVNVLYELDLFLEDDPYQKLPIDENNLKYNAAKRRKQEQEEGKDSQMQAEFYKQEGRLPQEMLNFHNIGLKTPSPPRNSRFKAKQVLAYPSDIPTSKNDASMLKSKQVAQKSLASHCKEWKCEKLVQSMIFVCMTSPLTPIDLHMGSALPLKYLQELLFIFKKAKLDLDKSAVLSDLEVSIIRPKVCALASVSLCSLQKFVEYHAYEYCWANLDTKIAIKNPKFMVLDQLQYHYFQGLLEHPNRIQDFISYDLIRIYERDFYMQNSWKDSPFLMLLRKASASVIEKTLPDMLNSMSHDNRLYQVTSKNENILHLILSNPQMSIYDKKILISLFNAHFDLNILKKSPNQSNLIPLTLAMITFPNELKSGDPHADDLIGLLMPLLSQNDINHPSFDKQDIYHYVKLYPILAGIRSSWYYCEERKPKDKALSMKKKVFKPQKVRLKTVLVKNQKLFQIQNKSLASFLAYMTKMDSINGKIFEMALRTNNQRTLMKLIDQMPTLDPYTYMSEYYGELGSWRNFVLLALIEKQFLECVDKCFRYRPFKIFEGVKRPSEIYTLLTNEFEGRAAWGYVGLLAENYHYSILDDILDAMIETKESTLLAKGSVCEEGRGGEDQSVVGAKEGQEEEGSQYGVETKKCLSEVRAKEEEKSVMVIKKGQNAMVCGDNQGLKMVKKSKEYNRMISKEGLDILKDIILRELPNIQASKNDIFLNISFPSRARYQRAYCGTLGHITIAKFYATNDEDFIKISRDYLSHITNDIKLISHDIILFLILSILDYSTTILFHEPQIQEFFNLNFTSLHEANQPYNKYHIDLDSSLFFGLLNNPKWLFNLDTSIMIERFARVYRTHIERSRTRSIIRFKLIKSSNEKSFIQVWVNLLIVNEPQFKRLNKTFLIMVLERALYEDLITRYKFI